MFRGFAEDRGKLPSIVVVSGGCWLWTGSVSGDDYAQWWKHDLDHGRHVHLVIWEVFNGPLEKGKQLDHLCRFKLCVNPAHLEPVTLTENLRRRVFKEAGSMSADCPYPDTPLTKTITSLAPFAMGVLFGFVLFRLWHGAELRSMHNGRERGNKEIPPANASRDDGADGGS